jgi:hypothetical protein
MSQGYIDNVKEVHKAKCTQIAPIAGEDVPPQISIRVVLVTARYPALAQKVLRHESKVYSNEELKELCLSMMLWVLATSKFCNPKVPCSKDTRHRTHTLYIMEMCYYIISQLVVISPVTRRIGLSLIKIFELNQS